jgi:hypothetical protein
MMKKYILLSLLVVLVIFLSACGENKSNKKKMENEKNNVSQNIDNDNKNKTMLYLVKIDREKKEQNDGLELNNAEIFPMDICSGKITEVGIDGKLSPQEVLEKLFSYKNDFQQGIYNTFSESKNIKIDKLVIKNNFATVILSGEIKADKMCGGQLMHDQIVKTLSQFDNIAGADIFVGDKEISEYITTMENKN